MTELNFNIPFEPFYSSHGLFHNLTGQRFNQWLVLSIYGRDKRGRTVWLCKCDCGTIGIRTSHFKYTIGCNSCESDRHKTHGMYKSPEYRSYLRAKRRCNSPKHFRYKYYGGRGIQFRFTSFEEFYQEVGHRPSPKHSLDRIDVNGHYEVGNVRWATPMEQAHNKQKHVYQLTVDNITHTLPEWSEITGISRRTLHKRLYLLHWCNKCTVTLPSSPLKGCSHNHSTFSQSLP